MPQRATSRLMLYGGVTLVLLSGVLLVGPVLLGRPDLADQLVLRNSELDGISKSVNAVRDAVDALREARGAERAYLLTGAQEQRSIFQKLMQGANRSIAELHRTAASPDTSSRFDVLTDRLLADLQAGAALQDTGRHDDAVATSNLTENAQIMEEIDNITRQHIAELRAQFLGIIAEIRTASELSDQFAHVMFGLAGAVFTLGCIALVTYQRRRLIAEAGLRTGRDAALEASMMKSRFVATASHDLRQPLHAISMFVGVLRRRSRDPAVLEVVENVATAVASMQHMFAALLDVARLDAGAVQPTCLPVQLQELLNTLELEFASSAAAKGLTLQFQPTAFWVTADAALLETILRNLISNAVKFTDRGCVGLVARQRNSVVDIIVFDTGIGIPSKDQTEIFDQFTRLSHQSGFREGLGLGLSIVKRMTALLEAELNIDSQPGDGSRFTLSLPMADQPQSASEEADPVRPDLQGNKILVLEDHPGARRAIVLALESLGAEPLEAASTESAFETLASMAPTMPDAAVVDHDLGGRFTGPEFLDECDRRFGQDLPAVIMTGSTEAAVLAELAARGRPWLIKPVEIETLRHTLAQLVAPALVE